MKLFALILSRFSARLFSLHVSNSKKKKKKKLLKSTEKVEITVHICSRSLFADSFFRKWNVVIKKYMLGVNDKGVLIYIKEMGMFDLFLISQSIQFINFNDSQFQLMNFFCSVSSSLEFF